MLAEVLPFGFHDRCWTQNSRLMRKRIPSIFTFIFVFAALFLVGCQKERSFTDPASEDDKELRKKGERRERSAAEEKAEDPGGPMELCSCPGFELSKDDGSFGCPDGDGGCSKIVPCPCPVVVGNPVLDGGEGKAALYALDEAIEENRVPEFFESGPWEEIFPFLEEEEGKLRSLQKGGLTLLRLDSSGDEHVHYAAVKAPAEELSDPGSAVFALQVPHTLFEEE